METTSSDPSSEGVWTLNGGCAAGIKLRKIVSLMKRVCWEEGGGVYWTVVSNFADSLVLAERSVGEILPGIEDALIYAFLFASLQKLLMK